MEILANATVSPMRAGSFEIVTPDFPGSILMADEDGDLVVDSTGGITGRVICCDAAREKLASLTDACETKMAAANPHYGHGLDDRSRHWLVGFA